MGSSTRHNLRLKERGLTLIEVLVVSPMIILIIGTVIVALVTITGESLVRRETNAVVHRTQTALDDIELDAQKSTVFLTTTGALLTPQGKNNSTTAFTNTTSSQPDTLIIRSIATTKNTQDKDRQIVYTNTPNTCGGVDESKNDPFTLTTVYFVNSGTLWKRTIVPNTSTACSTPWQRNSCASGQTTGACTSVLQDERILDNVIAMTVNYFTTPTSTTPLAASSSTSASTIEVTLVVETSLSGKTINYQAKTRVNSINIAGL